MHRAAWLALLVALSPSPIEAKSSSSSSESNTVSSSSSSYSESSSSASDSWKIQPKRLATKKHKDSRSLVEKMVGYPREKHYGRDGQIKPRPDLSSDASENEDFCTIM